MTRANPTKNNTRTFFSPLQIRKVSDEDRSVQISFSSEQPVQRWFGPEILCHDAQCVNLERLNQVGSVLFHHGYDPSYGSLPVARITEISLDETERKCRATLLFDKDEKSDLIYRKVAGGSLKGISFGYMIGTYEDVKSGSTSSNGRFQGPCRVATKWTPYEISLEPVPADDTVGVGRNYESEDNHMEPNTTPQAEPVQSRTDSQIMESETTPQTRTNTAQSLTAPTQNDTVAEERTRSAAIFDLCRRFNVSDENTRSYIEGGSTVDQVRAAILDDLSARSTPLASRITGGGEDGEDRYRRDATDGMLIRLGYDVANPSEGAQNFRGMSLRSLMVDCAMRSGIRNAHRMDVENLWTEMGRRSGGELASSSAFVSIINSAMSGVIRKAYDNAPTTYQEFVSIGSNPDFKATRSYRITASGDMEEIPENGEFPTVSGKDEEISTRIHTYGKRFGVSRQTIINDELGVVAKMVTAQVRATRRFINKKVYDALYATGKIYDGKKLFDESHKNLMVGEAPSIDAINKMIIAMASQTDKAGGDALNIPARFILAPMAISMGISQLLTSPANPEGNNAGVSNPLLNRFKLITDIYMDTKDNAGYFLLADPQDAECVELSFLNGKREPTLETQASWAKLGIEYRIYHDFGVDVVDYRGAVYNPGK